MNPNHLFTFAIVARFKSITQAAQYLHIGQPAVSGQLKLLQETVGEPLYERRGHHIELTTVGLGLLEYAQKMENDFKQAKKYVHRLQHINTGMLRLGATMTLASYYLPQYVVQLQTLYQGVQVFMETHNTDKIIRKIYDFDLGFVEGAVVEGQLPSNYQVIPWQEDEIVLIVAENHPIANQYLNSVPLEIFTQHQVIWREKGSGAREVIENALKKAKIDVSVNIEVTGVSGVKEAVRAGLGISFASSLALRNENKGLVARKINPPEGLRWQLNIIAPKMMLRSRVAKAFLKLCCQ